MRGRIEQARAGRASSGGHDGGEFAGFLQERGEQLGLDDGCIGEEFKPVDAFIGLFFANLDFCQKVCLAFSEAGRAVIGSNGSAAAEELLAENGGFCAVG